MFAVSTPRVVLVAAGSSMSDRTTLSIRTAQLVYSPSVHGRSSGALVSKELIGPLVDCCVGSVERLQWAMLQLQVTFVLCTATVHVRTVCVEAEQKNAKQNNRTWLEESENTKTFWKEVSLLLVLLL